MTYGSKRSFYYSALALLALSLVAVIGLRTSVQPVLADGGCSNVVVLPDGSVQCTQSGGNPGGSDDGGGGSTTPGGGDDGSNNNNNNNNNTGTGACTPGTLVPGSVYVPVDSDFTSGIMTQTQGEVTDNMCAIHNGMVDACTGEFEWDGSYQTVPVSNINSGGEDGVAVIISACPNSTPPVANPCDEFTVNGGGVTCTTDFEDGSTFPGSQWQLTVHTPWPGAEIHTRPYPVTLVNWDTVMRVMGLGFSSKTGHLSYAAWGGGSESSPAAGDWKDVTLRLEIKPVADWADVFLENIGLIRMRLGELHTFQWNLPSHPAAGGGPLSGPVGQLEELEPDVPLYTNWTRAPYMVYCTISYYEWKSTCVGGAGDNGELNCRKDSNGNFTGHREWGWKHVSKTTPITPDMAINQVPAGMLADLNGDGKPDAYWGRLSFIRRMDDNGNVNNPEWAHSYSWGPVWYWAVREAQGQIGWPGVPVP